MQISYLQSFLVIFFSCSDNKKIALHPYWPEQYSALVSWYLMQQFAVTEV